MTVNTYLDDETKDILKSISKELRKANELKALELRSPKSLTMKHDVSRIIKN